MQLGLSRNKVTKIFGPPDHIDTLDPVQAEHFEFPDEIVDHYSQFESYQYIEEGHDEPSISMTFLNGVVVQMEQLDFERPIIFQGLDLLHGALPDVLSDLNRMGGGAVLTDGDQFYFANLGIVVSVGEPGERDVFFVAPAYMEKDIEDGSFESVDINWYLGQDDSP